MKYLLILVFLPCLVFATQPVQPISSKIETKTTFVSPLLPEEAKKLSENQLFLTSFHAYKCSYILINHLHRAEEGQFLRWYAEELFYLKQNKTKNWNDINFPAAIEAQSLNGDQIFEMFQPNGQCYSLKVFAKKALQKK
jgi:hypothetical protein